jgi:ABC-2 type transport system permease protein
VINMVMMPVLLLSGILLPMTIGPDWLQVASNFMPFRYVVDAVRSAFGGAFDGTQLLWGAAWAVALCAIGVWWGTATFQRENA